MSVRLARASAELLLTEHGLKGPPIDVHELAGEMGLPILEENLGDGISGLLVRKGRGRTYICVAKADPQVRKRFTIAHELGHHHLRHEFDEGAVHVDHGNYLGRRVAQGPAGDQREYEANQFAAALLMPSKMVKAEVTRVAKRGALDEHAIEVLAGRFDVSVQAMTIRLTTLDLL